VKKKFMIPEVEVNKIDVEDIVTTSSESGSDDDSTEIL